MKHYSLTVLFVCLIAVVHAQCIDFTNLRASSVKCTYGSFSNPYQYNGIVDDGPNASSSRHTIHTNPNETDPRTDNMLHTIPSGEYASVRLGNWSTGSQAESITYEYQVDEEENPILVFKYAAVMEDPGHEVSDQPKLTLEILDASNNLIDSYCGAFNFIASKSLGWNVSSNGILWKNWTSVGLDLSAYTGQTIRIRFTTYDCNHSGHYGYAYLHIGCQHKRIKSLACGLNATTTFSGPDGFEYKWYTTDGTDKNIISTTQSIIVPTDETLYYCDVNQTGKPTCNFTLSVKATPRLPLANFIYEKRGTCVDTLFLTNTSSVSKDGQLPNTPHEDCDEYIWELGDGRIVTTKDINTPIIYAQSGTYTVKLTAKLSNGNCTHSISKEIHMHGYDDTHTSIIYDTICSNNYIIFDSQKRNKPGTYFSHTLSSYGCDSTTILHLQVNPNYYYEQRVDLCESETYNFHGKVLSQTGIYYDSLITQNGCDSIYKLTLKVHPTTLIETYATICDYETYDFRGRKLNKPGVYYDSLYSQYGCDSVYKLNLIVHNSYVITQNIEICNGDSYFFKGIDLNKSGLYYDSLLSITGCDSIIRLNLKINPTYLFEKKSYICENETYNFNGKSINKPGVYYEYYKTTAGCDSIYKLTLNVYPTYLFEEKGSTCYNHPYLYRNKFYTQTGIYYDSLKTINGCDSIYKLDLDVYPSYTVEESAIICDFDTYKFRGKLLNTEGVYYDTISSIHGCDSVYILNLRVRSTLRDTVKTSICLGDYYLFAGDMIYNDGVYVDTIYDPSSEGCEIHMLKLTTIAPTIISNAYVENACADDKKYLIKYYYTGTRPISYSLYYDNHARQMGFTDVLHAPFIDSIIADIPQFPNNIYLRPDKYNVRIEFDNGTCHPSQSAYNLTFMIKYPSWILEQNWNDVVAVLNTENNGGYAFARFDWYVNNDLFSKNDKSYIYTPQYLHKGDIVYADLTRTNEDYSICTCPIYIVDNSNNIINSEPVLIETIPETKKINIFAHENAFCYLYNSCGILIFSKQITANYINEIDVQLTGIYIIKVVTNNHKIYSKKLMVY